MARSYEEFHEQNKGKLEEDFNTQNKEAPDVETAEQKQERLERENHIQKRIQDKMNKITEERGAPQPTPSYVNAPNLSLDSIHREAIRRVQLETLEEKKEWSKNMVDNTDNGNTPERQPIIRNVETPTQEIGAKQTTEEIEKNNQEPEQVQNDQVQDTAEDQKVSAELPVENEDKEAGQDAEKPEKAFKAKMHEIVDQSQKRRSEASRTFIQNRKELLAEAEELGAENPAREVATAQRGVHKAINANEHKQLHTLFQENGWDYEKQGVQFVESETNTHTNTEEKNQEQTINPTYDQGEEQ